MNCLVISLDLVDVIEEGEAVGGDAPLAILPPALEVTPHNGEVLNAEAELIRGLNIERLHLNPCGELKGLPDHQW